MVSRMKKVLPVLLALGGLGLILQFVVNIFVTEKDTKYTIKTEDNDYSILEHFEIKNNKNFYNLSVVDKNNNFYPIFLEEDFNKQTEIIRDIKHYSYDNISCVFPIFRRNVTSNIICSYEDQIVSYDYLKQIGNKEIDDVVAKLKNSGYSHNSWDRKSAQKTNLFEDGRGIDVYHENILENYTFLIWRYKGLYILKNDNFIVRDYLDYDIYDNEHSILVGKYYVTAIEDSKTSRVSELYYYNTDGLGKGVIELPNKTSNKFYFNGVYDNRLYMTDIIMEEQYAINVGFEKVEKVGNRRDGFVTIEDDKIKMVEADEFLKENIYFDSFVEDNSIFEMYGKDTEILKDNNLYYFKTKDGSFYRMNIGALKTVELLFKFDNMTEWKVKDGDVLFIAGDKIYFYNDKEGLVLIAYNKELIYNYENIIDFWKK